MKEIIVPVVIAALGSAGLFGLIQFLISRKDKKRENKSKEREALRYLMLYIIDDKASKIIASKSITLDQKQMLHKWHDLYHNGLGGNGDADVLMAEIDKLPIKNKEREG